MPEHSRLDPLNLTHGALAEAMGVPRTLVNEPCNRRGGAVTAATALGLARVFGISAAFWLNAQRRANVWKASHAPSSREQALARVGC